MDPAIRRIAAKVANVLSDIRFMNLESVLIILSKVKSAMILDL
jgi:hypothetical protein